MKQVIEVRALRTVKRYNDIVNIYVTTFVDSLLAQLDSAVESLV